MKFKINAGEFVRSLGATLEVATKNTAPGVDTENMITIKSDKNKIIATSYGGSASVTTEISDKYSSELSYECEDVGEATFNADIMAKSLAVFKESDINVKLESNQLILSLYDDEDFVQCVPTYDSVISLPTIASIFQTEISINREILVDGIKKVQFAVGFAETQRKYLCLILKIMKKGVRFIAGSGGEFAIFDVVGKNISTGKDEIVFPNLNLSNITAILSDSDAKDIEIRYAEKDDDNNAPAQIVLTFKGSVLCLFKIDSAINYPKMDSILKFDYPNKISSDIIEWKRAVMGVEAADLGNKGTDKVPNTQVTLDKKNEYLHIETKGELKSKSKIKIEEDDSVIVDNEPWFKCNSKYLKNITTKCGIDSGDITISFENQQPPAGSDSRSHVIKPILVNFPDVPNVGKGVVESFKLFFIATTL